MTTHTVRPDVQAFLTYINAAPGPKIHEVSAEQGREMTRIMGHVAEVPVAQLAVIRNLTIPGPAGPIPARLFDTRETRPAGPVMVFYHGGGFVICDVDTHASYCAEVARQLDIPIISIDYRLAPEHPFPAAPDDCEAATRWIATSPLELGLNITGLITSGDSAGGNLAIVTTMALRDNPAAVPVILQHPIYPFISNHSNWQSYRDFSDGYLLNAETMIWFTKAYKADPDDWRYAPYGHDQSGMPPTLVSTASLDPLCDQGIAYYEAIKASGIPARYYSAEGNIHGYITLRKAVPSSQDDVTACMTLLKEMLADL
jgi:acetyl esterase